MLNTAIIQGRFVAVPELKKTSNGNSVCTFTLASERSFAKQGEERQTDWLDCVAWGKTAEHICKFFTKGQMIIIHGRIETRTYEDKNGNKRKIVEIITENAFFCESKKRDEQRSNSQNQGGFSQNLSEQIDIEKSEGEDLPF